jgi:hypothetical protein
MPSVPDLKGMEPDRGTTLASNVFPRGLADSFLILMRLLWLLL